MESDTQPILLTTHGYIKGQKRIGIYDDIYYSFERIPYARPPVGEFRFKPAVPSQPWDGVLDCTNFGDKPVQKNLFTNAIEGNEDCLHLNIYVKNLKSDKPLPVMFYIYGGSFQTGEATRDLYGPDYLMREDIVLVTFNYRLGCLGFLRFEDPKLQIPGNAGLRDQILALRWIKDNCINFNGDSNNITIFGDSAGGASVHYLMLTTHSIQLFHKAIMMSGTSYNKFAQIPPGDYAYRLAKINGYQGDNSDEQILKFLLTIEADKLITHELLTDEERLNGLPYVFGPTIEPYINEESVITGSPLEMGKNTWSHHIPVMIGGTSFEGLLAYKRIKDAPKRIQIFNVHPELLVPSEVRSKHSPEECKELGKQILKLHMGDAEIQFDNVLKYLDIYSYKVFWHGFYLAILARLKYSKAPTFVYRFDFDSPTFNHYRTKYCGPGFRGVSHGDDLSYLYLNKRAWKLDVESAEYQTIRRMTSMWTTFAKTSNPNCQDILPAVWESVNKKQPHKCLNISDTVALIELPESEKLEFWHSLHGSEELF